MRLLSGFRLGRGGGRFRLRSRGGFRRGFSRFISRARGGVRRICIGTRFGTWLIGFRWRRSRIQAGSRFGGLRRNCFRGRVIVRLMNASRCAGVRGGRAASRVALIVGIPAMIVARCVAVVPPFSTIPSAAFSPAGVGRGERAEQKSRGASPDNDFHCGSVHLSHPFIELITGWAFRFGVLRSEGVSLTIASLLTNLRTSV